MHSNLITPERTSDPLQRRARWLLPLLVVVGLLLWLPIVVRGFRRQPALHIARTQGRELRSEVGSVLFESPAPADLPFEPDLNPAVTARYSSTSPVQSATSGGP